MLYVPLKTYNMHRNLGAAAESGFERSYTAVRKRHLFSPLEQCAKTARGDAFLVISLQRRVRAARGCNEPI
jgi:hypothetical protein